MMYAQVLKWSLQTMRGAVLKCDSVVQSKILQKEAELLFNKTASHHEEETDWSIALVASVIVSLRPSTTVPNQQSLFGVLIRAAQSQKPFLITDTAAQAVASMLNKWVVASTNQVWHLFFPGASSSFVLSFVMALWFWVDLK
jgi:hypothetical protein